MSDFEMEIKLLMFLVEARVMLWDKKDGVYRQKLNKKRLGEKCVLVLKKTLKH